ncbi:SusE domain-containing protein [Mucilaginibacter sp. X5P1]|uniref:SusE domain-containing protein n=1 Tax=Mucilaginibacter sp. X5P1 TaxID=2723088 RepID=UPI00161A0800|nr:SusE domain-containing protein [Mucilaginibacter sp. X5P1]MBB6137812.1 hypothetical protein [Mucilaginibacter sp. X5P1]
MKKIFIIAAVLSFALLQACKKDKLANVGNIQAPVITSPSADTAIIVTAADSSQILKINWKSASYGVSAVVSYFVQVDSAGKNFSTLVNLGNLTSANSVSLSYGTLNTLLTNGLNLAPNAPTSVELRVGSAIYGKDTVYSKVVKIALTTFKGVDRLWLPGSYEGYAPANAPSIPKQSPNMFEGYAYFSAAGNFKFTSAPDYNHINYGDGGNGTLTTDGNAGGIGYSSAGVYLLDANTSALTYSASLISSMGIIGPATPGGWNASTAMTYNGNFVWSITINLIGSQPLKFRANDAWTINYGPAVDALTGVLQFNNPGAITIASDGNYTVTIDMSQSKTNAYTYTIVKN